MKLTTAQLRQIIKEEVTLFRARGKKARLQESHSRITKEEMEAWTRGDWDFVSESKELTDQLEKMSVEQLQEEYYNLDPDGNKIYGTGLIYGSGGEVQIDPSSKTYQDALKMLLVAAISELKEPGSTTPVDQPQQSNKIADLLRARGIEAY